MKKLTYLPANRLEKRVLNILNSYITKDYDVKSFCKDFYNGGTSSGIINELIYYNQTTKFFDYYKKEIMNQLQEIKENYGTNEFYQLLEKNNVDLLKNLDYCDKDFLVRLAFEDIAFRIFNYNEID